MTEPTYTLDAQFPDGRYGESHGLTAAQVEAARINAPRLGITIIRVFEETPVSVADLAPFGIRI